MRGRCAGGEPAGDVQPGRLPGGRGRGRLGLHGPGHLLVEVLVEVLLFLSLDLQFY